MRDLIRQIKMINDRIDLTIDIARKDFAVASAVVGAYEDAIRNGSTDRKALWSALVKDLQYGDIINQKLVHVQQLNSLVCGIQSQDVGRGSLLLLSCLQTLVAKHDFAVAATDFKTRLIEIPREVVKASCSEFHVLEWFAHSDHVIKELGEVSDSLKALGERVQQKSELNISEEYMSTLKELYTMERERYVLSWMMEHKMIRPGLLLSDYCQRFRQEKEEVELF